MSSTDTRRRIMRYTSSSGVTLYRLPMEVFPNFIGYSYLLLGAGDVTLVDTGSGIGDSTADLLRGLRSVRDDFGEAIDVTDIARIIVTHGHIDHFGGVADMLQHTNGAAVGIHPLDRRILTNYDERRTVATKDLTIFLERAGVRDERRTDLLNMYGFSKQHVQSVAVDFTFEEGDTLDGLEFFHVPGHCSGQVAIRTGDILLSADHILSRTSPHVAAESITHYTGLGHYRDSLRKLRQLNGIRLVLGGHEDPVDDLHGKIDYFQMRIDQKLERLLQILRNAEEPLPIVEISKRMYRKKQGFDVLLALQEAGAYVEYLYDRGYLAIANLPDFEADYSAMLLYTTTT